MAGDSAPGGYMKMNFFKVASLGLDLLMAISLVDDIITGDGMTSAWTTLMWVLVATCAHITSSAGGKK
jgi:hypothetical protein